MFLHLGGDVVIRACHVIAVLDARGARRAFLQPLLERAAAQGRLVDLAGGAARSVLVTDRGVYVLPSTPAIVQRRLEGKEAPWDEA